MIIKEIPVASIKVGTRIRSRGSNGELVELTAAIRDAGRVICPIGVSSDLVLVWGFRRLSVVKFLGWKTIPAIVDPSLDDAVEAFKAERLENIGRLDLRELDLYESAKRLGAIEKEKAAERQRAGGKDHGRGIASAQVCGSYKGDSRDKVAEAHGTSRRTIEENRTLVEKGIPPLVDAVDQGKLSRNAAATLATLPSDKQAEILDRHSGKKPREAGGAIVREVRAEEAKNTGRRHVASPQFDARLIAWSTRVREAMDALRSIAFERDLEAFVRAEWLDLAHLEYLRAATAPALAYLLNLDSILGARINAIGPSGKNGEGDRLLDHLGGADGGDSKPTQGGEAGDEGGAPRRP